MQNKEQAVSQQTSIQLPSFNEVIEVKVEVQDIFNKLLSEFPEEYKHRELVAHAIVGSTKDNPAIAFIYNALNGYSPLIDFKVGDMVKCTTESKVVRYDSLIELEDGGRIAHDLPDNHKPMWKYRKVPIGKCKVVRINLYASDKLEVEFEQDDRYEIKKETVTRWVSHKLCTKWAQLAI